MTATLSPGGERTGPADEDLRPEWRTVAGFPYWAVLIAVIVGWFAYLTFFVDDYNDAWEFIKPGFSTTIRATLYAFGIALVIGLLGGLGRLSGNVVLRTVARTYIEFIRGVPTLPLLLFMTYVILPDVARALGGDGQTLSTEMRGVISLALIYGGYMAEVFRGGIQSVPRGQVEAGRSLGLSGRATMQSIVLPQAMRAIIPPLGNDFIAILKDTSLLSLLAIRELTQNARLYQATNFNPRTTYVVLTFCYLILVIGLSLALNAFERWMTRDQKDAR